MQLRWWHTFYFEWSKEILLKSRIDLWILRSSFLPFDWRNRKRKLGRYSTTKKKFFPVSKPCGYTFRLIKSVIYFVCNLPNCDRLSNEEEEEKKRKEIQFVLHFSHSLIVENRFFYFFSSMIFFLIDPTLFRYVSFIVTHFYEYCLVPLLVIRFSLYNWCAIDKLNVNPFRRCKFICSVENENCGTVWRTEEIPWNLIIFISFSTISFHLHAFFFFFFFFNLMLLVYFLFSWISN